MGTYLLIGQSRIAIGDTRTFLTADRSKNPESSWIERTTRGDRLVVPEHGSPLMINGETVGPGMSRSLSDGDCIAFDERIAHYVTNGAVMPQLERIEPVQAGRISVDRDEFVIGRARQVDLRLDHPTVMLRHAVVRRVGDSAEIAAESSNSIVRVNGVPVSQCKLVAGDEIAIGPYKIAYGGTEFIEHSVDTGLAINADGVTVQRGGATILQPTDVMIGAGEMVALIGESGAGKSTLMNVLAGVTAASAGYVRVGDEPIDQRLPEIGYVPQFDIVHGRLTAREALDYAARLRLPQDTSESERRARVDAVLDDLALAERADVLVDHLSGGQRKRVAVGSEILHRPGALFLDEPTTGLDPGLERQLMRHLRSLADRGQTVMLVTHATGSIALCDRVIVMGRGGRVRFAGRPDVLLESFGVDSFDDVYLDPDDVDGPTPRRKRLRFDDPAPGAAHHSYASPRRDRVQQSFPFQVATLAGRNVKLMARDRGHIRGAMLQVPILGILTALLFPRLVFDNDPARFAGKSAQLVFLMTMVAAWLGSVSAAREIVKERSVLSRELSVGLRLESYIASKVLVLSSLVAAQILVFTAITLLLRPPHEPAPALFSLLLILIVTGVLAILIGLVVSAMAKSEDQATGVIPLLLVPQLLLSGAIVTIADMTIFVKVLSLAIPARWSFAAAGNAIGLDDRIESDKAFRAVSRYGHNFFDINLPQFLAVSGLFASALLVTTILLLREGEAK